MSMINLFNCAVSASEETYALNAPGLNFKAGTTLQGMPVNGTKVGEVPFTPMPMPTFSGEIEALRISLLLADSIASVASLLSAHGQTEPVFTDLAWYQRHEDENRLLLAELKSLRELKRRAALGLLSCACPPAWHKAREAKNKVLSSLASFLCQVSAEHRRTDAYRIGLSDLMPVCPRVDRQNRALGQSDWIKLVNAQFSKLRAELIPLVDPWETDDSGKPIVKRQAFNTPICIEKLKGYECLWEIRFDYPKQS